MNETSKNQRKKSLLGQLSVLAECRPTDAVEFLVRQLGCGVAADEACKEECGGDD